MEAFHFCWPCQYLNHSSFTMCIRHPFKLHLRRNPRIQSGPFARLPSRCRLGLSADFTASRLQTNCTLGSLIRFAPRRCRLTIIRILRIDLVILFTQSIAFTKAYSTDFSGFAALIAFFEFQKYFTVYDYWKSKRELQGVDGNERERQCREF
jgi:hypothetical protein